MAISYALVRWQLLEKDEFIAIANERFREIKIPAIRGSILASDGTTLAFSEPRFDFYLWRKELEEAEEKGLQDRGSLVKGLSEILLLSEEDVLTQLNSDQLWIKVAGKITVEQRDKLLELKGSDGKRDMQGMRFEYVNARNYPEGRLASHTLGFFGFNEFGEPVGIGGLEQFWERSLKPIEGYSNSEVDSFGNAILVGDAKSTEAKPGVNIVTTIDKNLQAILETKLQDGTLAYQAKSASGIIMDPKTGAIMALSNFPNFDPNVYFDESDGEIFGNKSITTPYEVGSVAKIFTLAAALDSKKLEFDELILPDGHQGCEVITPDADPKASCNSSFVQCICTYDKKPVNQQITVIDALVTSDNIAFKHIGGKLSSEEFRDYLQRFGVGKLTGIDLTGESTGYLPEASMWGYSDNAVFSYGHGYQVTPLQAIMGVSVMANQGKRMQPYLVEKVVSPDGEEKVFEARELEQTIDPIIAQRVANMMNAVFRNNIPEKRYENLKEYNISMKSGTALVPYKDKPGYSEEINATYVGFDNSGSKKFIMLIKLEEPQVGDLSFYNARMLWLDTFIAIKDYLLVPKGEIN